jgi:hypothetical protein
MAEFVIGMLVIGAVTIIVIANLRYRNARQQMTEKARIAADEKSRSQWQIW